MSSSAGAASLPGVVASLMAHSLPMRTQHEQGRPEHALLVSSKVLRWSRAQFTAAREKPPHAPPLGPAPTTSDSTRGAYREKLSRNIAASVAACAS